MSLAVIDVGKTGTRMRLDGRTAEAAGLDPARPPGQTGDELAALLLEVWEAHGSPAPSRAFIGSTARPDDAEFQHLRLAVEAFWPDTAVAIADDAVLAHATCVGGPGMVVIAGSGSIALGYESSVGWQRCDGWGPGAGDRGSGYSLGAAALQLAFAHVDGVVNRPELAELVAAHFGEPLGFPLAERLARDPSRTALVASLAESLLESRDLDEVAEILDHEAAAIADTAAALARRVGFTTMSLTGRLGKTPEFSARVAAHLAEQLRLVKARYGMLEPPEDVLFSSQYQQLSRRWGFGQ